MKQNKTDLCVLGGVWCGWNDSVLFCFVCLLFLSFKGPRFEGMLKAVRARDFEGGAVEEQALGRTIHPGVNPTCITKAGPEGSCIIACPPFVKASTRSFNPWIGFV